MWTDEFSHPHRRVPKERSEIYSQAESVNQTPISAREGGSGNMRRHRDEKAERSAPKVEANAKVESSDP